MKSVIITGANRGIGLDTAIAFGRAGYKVFATMRNPDNAITLKRKIQEESLPITISAMDVNSDTSVKRCINAILKDHGTIDVLVNNAGIERHGSIEELTMDDFKSIIDTFKLENKTINLKVIDNHRKSNSPKKDAIEEGDFLKNRRSKFSNIFFKLNIRS